MYYIKINTDNVVIDATTQQHDEYIPTNIETVPPSITAGRYKRVDDELVIDNKIYYRANDIYNDLARIVEIEKKAKDLRLQFVTLEVSQGDFVSIRQQKLDQKGQEVQQEYEALLQHIVTQSGYTIQEVLELIDSYEQ